jgi:hypothetical protein
VLTQVYDWIEEKRKNPPMVCPPPPLALKFDFCLFRNKTITSTRLLDCPFEKKSFFCHHSPLQLG